MSQYVTLSCNTFYTYQSSNYVPARINGENAEDLTTISRVVVYRVTETRYNDRLSGEQFYGLPHCVSETRQTCSLTLGRIFSSNVNYRKTSHCWTYTDRRQTSSDLENTARSAGRYKKKKKKETGKERLSGETIFLSARNTRDKTRVVQLQKMSVKTRRSV